MESSTQFPPSIAGLDGESTKARATELGKASTLDRLLAYFPFPTIRPVQQASLDVIADSRDRRKRFTLLELPTGAGKSGIGIATARFSEQEPVKAPGAHMLTSQNTLLNQMVADFGEHGLVDIRGKNNYSCYQHGSDCATGALCNNGKPCSGCPYRIAKEQYLSSPLGVTNYSYYLSETRHSGELKPREYLVLDEAHNLEDEVLARAHVEVTSKWALELEVNLPHFEPEREDQILKWLHKVYAPAAAKLAGSIRADIHEADRAHKATITEDRRPNSVSQKLRRHLAAFDSLNGNVCEYMDAEDRRNWFAWTDSKGSLVLRPLSAAPYAREMLSASPNTLIMSATMLDFGTFMRSLGIDRREASVFAAPSDFPKANRRIVYWPTGSMGYKDIEETLPRIALRIEKILEKYEHRKGIIHTHSFRINEYLRRYFEKTSHKSRLLTHGEGLGSREDAIRNHLLREDPTILLSPSMTEGLDLKDDLSRFQIICKVPYPFLDPYTRARMERDDKWYQLKTALSLVQATGRSVRSQDDYAVTVILDSAFERFLLQNQNILPEWWKEAIEFK